MVVTASWSVVGRFRERYDPVDEARARALLDQLGVAALADRRVRHAVGGRAQAGADRPGPDDRPGAAAARRAGGRARPRRPGGPGRAGWPSWRTTRTRRRSSWSRTTWRRSRAGFTHALLLREGTVVAHGLLADTVTSENLSKTFGLPLRVDQERRPVHRPRRA